jgi:hypothetical protein
MKDVNSITSPLVLGFFFALFLFQSDQYSVTRIMRIKSRTPVLLLPCILVWLSHLERRFLSLCHFRYSCSCFDLDLQLLPRFSCSCLDLAFLASSTIIYLSSFCCTHTGTSSRQTGKRVVNPRVASSREDRATMANGCFWLASTETAEFLCLNVWTYHPLGRGREVSFLKADDIGSADTNDQEIEYELLGVNIQRDKTGLVQDLNLYPHKHAMQHHPYFAIV